VGCVQTFSVKVEGDIVSLDLHELNGAAADQSA
jgi:hypothetical protein